MSPYLLFQAVVLSREFCADSSVDYFVEKNESATGAPDLDLGITETLLAAKDGRAAQVAYGQDAERLERIMSVLVQHAGIIVIVVVENGQAGYRDYQEHRAELEEDVEVGIDTVAQL